MSVSIIPESAPFTPEQRSWLNGFLAGWAGILDEPAPNGVAAALAPGAEATTQEEQDEDYPWHDPGLEMGERLELAEGKPLKRKLMAAMAQLDCGACGYVCQSYSEAIAAGEEKNLKLCSPGGKDTAKKLKELLESEGGVTSNGNGNGSATNGAAAGFTRANPYFAKVKHCENLNKDGASKQTTHVELELGDSGLEYAVGDALGVYPINCGELVDEVLAALGVDGGAGLRDALATKYCLRAVNDELLELLADAATEDRESEHLKSLIDSDDLDVLDVLDVLRLAPSAKVSAEQFTECLTPLAPRLYSIASSPKAHPGEVHLTVGRATFNGNSRTYKGVASTMFAERVAPGDKVGVYVHKAHGFTVPNDPTAPMIMVGPGTGIAPFRAFLEERHASGATGDNWLFFGDQHAATDYLYEQQFNQLVETGFLPRVSLAFSRDQEAKVYVQDKMREEGAELFAWLERGGHFFVCGDARRMAVDVDRALHEAIATHGGLSDDDAKAYVGKLKDDGRYVRDVY